MTRLFRPVADDPPNQLFEYINPLFVQSYWRQSALDMFCPFVHLSETNQRHVRTDAKDFNTNKHRNSELPTTHCAETEDSCKQSAQAHEQSICIRDRLSPDNLKEWIARE